MRLEHFILFCKKVRKFTKMMEKSQQDAGVRWNRPPMVNSETI